MACGDGCRLATRLWSREGSGPWPALLMRQPYGRAIASTVTYAHPGWYAARGYLVVVQDVRGRGDSEGEFSGFAQEATDGSECLRWLRSLPECNGLVGCYGFSYQGATQLLWDNPDELPDCLVPAMTGLDERRDWACEGGAHRWALGLAWALQLAAEGCRRRGDDAGWREIRAALGSGAFLDDGISLLERLDPQGMGMGWLHADPTDTGSWRLHGVAPELLRRPLLLIGGWLDPHLRGILDLWQRSRAAGGSPSLRIGAWSHLNWAGGIDQLQLAFFQRHLQGPAQPEPASVHLQDLLDGRWQRFEPGDGPAAPGWCLRSDGLAAIRVDEGILVAEAATEAAAEPAAEGTTVWLVHDPWRPVPGRGGHLGLDAGLCERADLDARGDVLCFTTPPLQAPLRLCGSPRLRIPVAADQHGFDLCGALSVVAEEGDPALPGGVVRQLSTGVARFLGPECLALQERQLAFQPLLATLRPGQRLRLSLAAAAWPQIAVNPGDGLHPAGPTGAGHRVITLRFTLRAARLWLDPLPAAHWASRPDSP